MEKIVALQEHEPDVKAPASQLDSRVTFCGGDRLSNYDATKLEEVLKDLELWFQRFSRDYEIQLNTVPKCWAQHAALVEMLYALYCFDKITFESGEEGSLPISYQQNINIMVGLLIQTSKSVAVKCRQEGEHSPNKSVEYPKQDWSLYL